MRSVDAATLFADLCTKVGVQPDAHGEAHITCIFCGKEPKRGQVHASFSERGFHCFICGQSASLRKLAEMWGDDVVAPIVAPRPKRRPAPRVNFDDLVRRCEQHPERVARWQQYKPLSEYAIKTHRLGVGAFPYGTSKCRHERLMVPLFDGTRCAGFRGRAIACDCPKWLSPAGSRMVLYNADSLCAARGKLVAICENPIDALLLQEHARGQGLPVTAVATLGVSMWQDAWTDLLRDCGARAVVVMYDNDLPGNGGGAVGRETWLATHPKLIEPGGVRLANRLREAGINARLYDWGNAPLHADVGSVLKEVA